MQFIDLSVISHPSFLLQVNSIHNYSFSCTKDWKDLKIAPLVGGSLTTFLSAWTPNPKKTNKTLRWLRELSLISNVAFFFLKRRLELLSRLINEMDTVNNKTWDNAGAGPSRQRLKFELSSKWDSVWLRDTLLINRSFHIVSFTQKVKQIYTKAAARCLIVDLFHEVRWNWFFVCFLTLFCAATKVFVWNRS